MSSETGSSSGNDTPDRSSSAGRRSAMLAGLAASPLLLLSSVRSANAAATTAFQDITKYGADPTGRSDSSMAFERAFARLPGTGGCLYCPAGTYLLDRPVSLNGKSVAIKGDGSNVTVFAMGHAGVAFSFVTGAIYNTVNIFGICVAGPPHALAAGAIAIVMPGAANETGYQSCFIDDVSIGSPHVNASNGCQIASGLHLANIWKAQVSNVRMFGPYNTSAQSSFVTLASSPGSKCVDNKFLNCVSDGPTVAFNVTGYSEGITVSKSLLIGSVGFTCAGVGKTGISVLGLYIDGCEIQSELTALQLNQVWSAWIGTSHLGATSARPDGAVVNVVNCVNLIMNDLWVTGSSTAGVYGMAFSGGAINRVNGLTLENLTHGVYLGEGVSGTLILGIQMVDTAGFPILRDDHVVIDNSGNRGHGSNNAQWLTSLGPLRTLY